MDWLSNPVVWIAIALIVLAVGSVLLLPLLRRPARPAAIAREEPASTADMKEEGEIAATATTRVSVRKPEVRSKRPIPASAEETPAAKPVSTLETVTRPTPKAAATPPPKPIDELLKDIDFNLGDERSRIAAEGKSASPARGVEAQRMPDTEPPTASVTRTPGPLAPPAKLAPAPAQAPSPPQPLLEPLSELPSGLQMDKLEFDLGELGLDSTRKPVELPPLELKPASLSKSANLAALNLSLPDTEPTTQSGSAPAPPKPKASDLKFEFTDVSQEPIRPREDLARLDEELQSFGGGLDLGKMEAGGSLGGDAGTDYIETKLDLAAAYLDMGDQVGARGLLEDVLQEGDAAQKKRAEDLLKKLG